MEAFFAKIKEWLELGHVPLFGLALSSGILLFAPSNLLEDIGVVFFAVSYRMHIGLAFLLSVCLLFSMAINGLWDTIFREFFRQTINARAYRKELWQLNEDEKVILRRFFEEGTRAQSLSIQDGVVLGLQKRMIIIRVGDVGHAGYVMSFPFNIQPWAWEYLKKHPELIT